MRTQTVLARLIADNPDEYDGWTLTDLSATLAECGVTPVKPNGVMTVRTEDVAAAIAARDDESAGEAPGEATGSRGVLPTLGSGETPRPEQGKRDPGRRNPGERATPPETPENRVRRHHDRAPSPTAIPMGAAVTDRAPSTADPGSSSDRRQHDRCSGTPPRTSHTQRQKQSSATPITRSPENATATTHPNRPTSERTSSTPDATDTATTEPTHTPRVRATAESESPGLSEGDRIPHSRPGTPGHLSGLDPGALYAYHLERVTRKFTTVISAENAELLGRLLGDADSS